jgi:hypothetical protein
MRPHRYRMLPDAPHALAPAAKQAPPAKPEGKQDAPQKADVDPTMVLLLASMLDAPLFDDIRKLYPYLSPKAQTVASAAITARADSAQLSESARIRTAIAQYEGNHNPHGHGVWKALMDTETAQEQGFKEPLGRMLSSMDEAKKMQSMLASLQGEGPAALLSKQLMPNLGDALGAAAPLLGAMTGGGGLSALLPMLMQSTLADHPLLAMLQKGAAAP